MAGDFFSASWYRVERLKPRLRSHVQLLRHQYRERTWYVLQDLSADRFHRFAPAAYHVIGLMDGRRPVRDIWEAATAALGDDAPTQDEVIRLLSQLHATDLIVCDGLPDIGELQGRADRQQRRARLAPLFNLLSWRFPLCDPDRFLTWLLPLARPFVGWVGGLLWMLVAGLGMALAALHWSELTADVLDQVLAPHNVLLLWLLFPLVKLCHELGHGLMTKAFGGEVHDLGVMLLVFTPVPYCEASAAWSFRSKWQRILVGAAGMMTELFLATLALVVWLNAEPGLVRLLAYNTILIAGVSTLLFNANPLLRFDGYYMLMDYLEIPNLRQRATKYLSYLCERYLFGQRDTSMPSATPGERVWFVGYGLASMIYRVLVVIGILLFLGDQLPLLAVPVAGLTAVTMLGLPLVKGLSFLLTSPTLQQVRPRAIAVTAALVVGLVTLLGLLPAPFHTMAEGVVWMPDESFVRAGTDGFVEQVVARPGTSVTVGQVLVICRHPASSAVVRTLQARVQELESRYLEQRPTDLVKAAIIQEELAYAKDELARAQRRVDDLVIRSRADGVFILPAAEDLPGRYVKQGELLAHVVDLRAVTVRSLVPQADIDLVRHRPEAVHVRLAERLGEVRQATLTRIVPTAGNQLPSRALGTEGGGIVPLDPTDDQGMKTMQHLFQVDLTVPGEPGVVNVGGRVYVRFSHGWVPLSDQWYRQIRQLFLTRFNV